MKRLFFFIFLFSGSHICAAQMDTAIKSLTLKRGIYLSFKQVMENNPAITDSFIVKERRASDIVWVGGGQYSFELLSSGKKGFRAMRKAMIGLSDGQNFYVSGGVIAHRRGGLGMSVCILSGPYLITAAKSSISQFTGGGIIGAMIQVENGFLININDGSCVQLSKHIIKKLLVKYPDLQAKYEAKDRLMDHAVEIVNVINGRAEKSSS